MISIGYGSRFVKSERASSGTVMVLECKFDSSGTVVASER